MTTTTAVQTVQKIGPHHYRVPSKSRPGVFHEVQLEPVVLCTCEAFYFRGKCPHIQAAKEAARGSGVNGNGQNSAAGHLEAARQAYIDLFGEEPDW